MAGDLNKPAVADQYATLLQYIRDNFADLATAMEFGQPANLPVGAKRFNASTRVLERWSGSSWVEWGKWLQTAGGTLSGALNLTDTYRIIEAPNFYTLQLRTTNGKTVVSGRSEALLAANARVNAQGNWVRETDAAGAYLLTANQTVGIAVYTAAAGSGNITWNGPYAVRHDKNHFHGRVSGAGAALRLPAGWSCSRQAEGAYRVIHNLGTPSYSLTATASALTFHSAVVAAQSATDFNIYTQASGGLLNAAFSFTLDLD